MNETSFDELVRRMETLSNAKLLAEFEAAVNDAAILRHDDSAQQYRYRMHAARKVLKARLGIK